MVSLCVCEKPGRCHRFPKTLGPMTGRLYELCSGNGCTPELSEQYRAKWDADEAASTADPILHQTFDVKSPCRYFDENPIDRGGCGSCQAKWVYPCEVLGTCSPAGNHIGVKSCNGCDYYEARNSDSADRNVTRLILVNPLCPGDVLVMSAAIESLHIKYPGRYVTAFEGTAPEIFHHNPNVVTAHPYIDGDLVAWNRIEMSYPLVNECDKRPVHFMQGYCDFLADRLGVPVPLLVNRPYITLSPEERGWTPQVHEVEPGVKYWLINAGFKNDFPAKFWGTRNFQRVVDLLKGKVRFVQIGDLAHNHPPLTGVIDMRGKTDIRQLVRMTYFCAGGVGPSTFLQHLCAAFDRPYINLAGGREPLAWQHYPRQLTLSTIGVTPCSTSRHGRSCWCDRAEKSIEKPNATICELPVVKNGEVITACLDSISPERVAEEIMARYNVSTSFS